MSSCLKLLTRDYKWKIGTLIAWKYLNLQRKVTASVDLSGFQFGKVIKLKLSDFWWIRILNCYFFILVIILPLKSLYIKFTYKEITCKNCWIHVVQRPLEVHYATLEDVASALNTDKSGKDDGAKCSNFHFVIPALLLEWDCKRLTQIIFICFWYARRTQKTRASWKSCITCF